MGGVFSFSVPCDQFTKCLGVKASYIHNLEENLTALETAMGELKARRDDLSRKVEREEMKGLRKLSQVHVWLDNVETIESKVNALFNVRTTELQRLCLCGFCSKSLKLSYRYGKRVYSTLEEVQKLKSIGVFEVVAEKPQASEVVERPIQPTIVGRETILETAWNRLMKDGVGVMGLHGMGGVGKTTLLEQINNRINEKEKAFDVVIFVVVSKDLQIQKDQKIQEKVAKKLGLAGEEWNQKDEDQKACDIHNALKKKRFVLLLDDIWAKVELARIGVPFPSRENGCKVVFTTRSKEVCGSMGVDDEMEVQCLSHQDALDLFKKKVGEITLRSDPKIPKLAEAVAKKCHGLPLALNVIGEAMASKRTVQEWRYAYNALTSYAAQFSGMEDRILPILKYSYDNLKGEQVRSCFLYCALFPEDDRIPKDKLIEYWIGEGIIDAREGIERAEDKGYEIIGSLVRASLLMEVEGAAISYVSLHDVVRDMALWIASDLGGEKDAVVVHASVGLSDIPKIENWSLVKRMSLMNNRIHHLDGSPECLKLTTLLVQNNFLEMISSDFSKSMPNLLVLDLSGNRYLYALPDSILELGNLQYLNLSETAIPNLPRALLELKKLFHLDLWETRNLSSIDGISNLHNLKVLKLYYSGSWRPGTVEELETLEHLQVLIMGFEFVSPETLEQFLSSRRLTSCTRSIMIKGMEQSEASDITLPVTMKKLRYFSICGCKISEIKMVKISNKSKMISPLHNPRNIRFSSLSEVFIKDCERLRELTWLMFAPNLRSLHVRGANELEDIINKEKASKEDVPFPNLISMILENLPMLKNIYWRPLPFPCLKKIYVERCPNLKKLPLDSKSGTHGEDGLVITYEEQEWIDGVEWEDEATKTRFMSSCKKEV
ncbi:unnamed protein product [Thlaspi arvense]|uniref:NB-ARC domain-containing protein n=1 Tax=Thlaspi arvense TaxID=13288 RepID=A0AAU9RR68_THLAR|nr:unnamed protein product [Thlaspi arvense]